jgi:galactose mutarotase-like enzyme
MAPFRLTDGQRGPFASVTLRDEGAGSSAEIIPSRGAIVTRFQVGAESIFYLEEETLLDAAKNVRGGNPILFPSPGRLAGDRFSRGGRLGALPQHGFARTAAWQVVGRRTDDAAALTLRLEHHAPGFPWASRVDLEVALAGATLTFTHTVTNLDEEPLPFAFGFHPYFRVPDAAKGRAKVRTKATRAWDNVAKREVALPQGVDLLPTEVDLHLLDHGSSEARLTVPDQLELVVAASPEYTRWVVWTLAGRDFVCLEPWTAPADALNTGEGLIELAPGASRTMWVSISAQRPKR